MSATVSVFGLGYVGCVSAACLAAEGHQVVGVDVSRNKVEQINAGRSTVAEQGIAELVATAVSAGRLSATEDVHAAIQASEVSLVCVGTPSRPNGSIDLEYVLRVSRQIGTALSEKRRWHTVVIRSTVMPGTIDTHVIPAIESASGLKHGTDFAVCSNPEFLREGSSVKDFHSPPFTIVGAVSREHAEPVLDLYRNTAAAIHVVPLRVAEAVKYACNCFHAVKVGFANEIGNFCKAVGIDSHEVMRLFCEDTKLNLSAAYLKPGFAFGGSCLPKDLRAMTHRGRTEDVEMPILEAVLVSNRKQIDRAFHMIMASGCAKIGLLGLAFKAGTDDLRESPSVGLIEMLIGKGRKLLIHDSDVAKANIVGANREYVEREIPHLWSLMRNTTTEVIEASEIVVIGNLSPEYKEIGGLLEGKLVIDLARAIPNRLSGDLYQGICW